MTEESTTSEYATAAGAVLGGRMMNPDEYFKDWAWRRDTGDLCPECYEEYKRVIERFNANRRRKRVER